MSHTSEIKQAGLLGDLSLLREVQLLCGFTITDAAAYCGVSPQTFRRWRTDRVPPVAAVKLLAIRSGALPWPDWHGWEMHGERLFAPGMNRHGYRPGNIYAVTFLQQLVSAQRIKIHELRAEVERLSSAVEIVDKARAV